MRESHFKLLCSNLNPFKSLFYSYMIVISLHIAAVLVTKETIMNFYYQVLLKSDKSDRLQLNSFSRIIDFLGLWFCCHRLKQRFLQTSLFETTSCLGLEMNSSVETSEVHSGCDSDKKLGMQGWRPSYVNSETSAAFISVIIANSIVLPFSICLNVLVIIVVIKTPRLRNK